MPDEEVGTQVADVRRAIAAAVPKHIDAKTVELAAFTVVGQRELGLRLWADAREAAATSRRGSRRAMRKRLGARSPNGWLSFVAFGGALCAAVAAVLTSGVRFDPTETATATAVLAALAGVASLLVLIVAAGRPLNRSMIRIHGVMTAALIVAAALMLSRGAGPTAIAVGVCAAVSVIGYVLIFVARARDHAATEQVDTAINVALAQTHPDVQALSRQLRADAARELAPGDAARIVEVRTIVLADLAAEGVAIAAVDVQSPAGSIIIDDVIGTWVPEVLRGEV